MQTVPQNHAQLPLTGIRVLDFTQFLSGPFCTQMLGDLGAEIIKLESPEGDLARHIPPYFVGGDSVYYLSINRNKQSLALDLKHPEGQAIARALCQASDIVIENFRPGIMDRLGLSAAAARAEKPGLIWCAISGFGQDGPYRDKPAYDMIVQALSGGMSLTGEPGRCAVRAGIPLGDLAAGMYASSAILAALHRRNATGIGDFIDISMLDCQAAMLCYQAAYHLHSGQVPDRQGSGHDAIPTYRGFTALGGTELVICANTERMWRNLCAVLGVAELVEDARFLTNRLRQENRRELWPILETAFGKRTATEWIPLLDAASVPAAQVSDLAAVMNDPQILHRGMVQGLKAEDGRDIRVMADPMRFAVAPRRGGEFPPQLGQDGENLLRRILGLSTKKIKTLHDSGVVSSQLSFGGIGRETDVSPKQIKKDQIK